MQKSPRMFFLVNPLRLFNFWESLRFTWAIRVLLLKFVILEKRKIKNSPKEKTASFFQHNFMRKQARALFVEWAF